jgi:hypothetical protein
MQDTQKTLQQFELTAKLLGPETKYRVSRTDNHRIHDKKNLMSAESLKLKLMNSTNWTNYKIDPKSAPKDHTYIVLDYDDHGDEPINLQELQKSVHQYFGLKETFTVKTPSGTGFQEWYIIETDVLVNKIKKNNFQSIELPDKTLPIEIKTCLPDFNVTLEGPGTYRQSKSEYYTIIQETEPVKLAHKLTSFLIKLSESERQRTVKKLEIRSRTADITEDSFTNIESSQNELIKHSGKFLFGIEKIEEHRNDYLYRMAMEIYTFNLSYEKGMEVLQLLQQSVFSCPLEDWEFEATNKSAYNRIRDARREFENSFDHIMEEFPKDDYGFVNVDRELYTARVEHLTGMVQNFMLSNNTNRRAFCETLIKTDENICVPVKVSHKSFEQAFAHEYNQYKQGTNPRFSVLFDALQKCSLYWKKLSYAEFNNNYTFIPEGLKNNKKVSGTSEFNNYSNVVHIIHEEPSAAKAKYILENGTANIGIKKDIEIPVESINSFEKKELEFFHNIFRRALTDEKKPEEYNFLLDRIALPLQHPNVNIDNVTAFYGKQGIGKTAFFTFISSLFNLDVVGIYPDFESFIAPHEEMKEMTLIEEVHLIESTQTLKIWDKIKAISTSEMQHVNKKFIQSVKIARSINIFTTSNHLPDSLTILEDRRLTLLYSPNPRMGTEIETSMKRIAKFLFGYPGAELRGLRVLYTDLINRKVKRQSWNYKPYFQKELCMELNADNKQLQCIMNYVANLGIVPNSDIRYPINEIEELKAEKDPILFITNRYDHLVMFKYVYVNPYEHKDKIGSANKEQLRNSRLGGWFNKHSLSSAFSSCANDPEKRTTSHLLKDKTTTFTMIYPSVKRTLKLMKEYIKVYGLEDHVQFLKDNDNPTSKSIKEFLITKYPEEEPGSVRLYNYLEIQTDEDTEW